MIGKIWVVKIYYYLLILNLKVHMSVVSILLVKMSNKWLYIMYKLVVRFIKENLFDLGL